MLICSLRLRLDHGGLRTILIKTSNSSTFVIQHQCRPQSTHISGSFLGPCVPAPYEKPKVYRIGLFRFT